MEYPGLVRAKTNEATVRLMLSRKEESQIKDSELSNEKAKEKLSEINRVVELYEKTAPSASTEWLKTVINEDLAVARMVQADLLWEKRDAKLLSSTSYLEAAERANQLAKDVRMSLSGDPEFFFFSAEILCAQIQFKSPDNKAAYQRASANWDTIATLLREAKARGAEIPSMEQLQDRYPHLEYISNLGEDIRKDLEKIISEQ
jgi:hypothetical protein